MARVVGVTIERSEDSFEGFIGIFLVAVSVFLAVVPANTVAIRRISTATTGQQNKATMKSARWLVGLLARAASALAVKAAPMIQTMMNKRATGKSRYYLPIALGRLVPKWDQG